MGSRGFLPRQAHNNSQRHGVKLPRGQVKQGNLRRKLESTLPPFVLYMKHNMKRHAEVPPGALLLFSPLCSDCCAEHILRMGDHLRTCTGTTAVRRQRLLSAAFGAGLGWTVSWCEIIGSPPLIRSSAYENAVRKRLMLTWT